SPRSCAAAEIGDGSTRRPRPLGRSGWLTTAATSCSPRSARRASVGSAKSGVPKKIRRTGGPSGGRLRAFLGFALQLLLALRDVEAALEPADPIDEQLAVEVVDLVLEAHRLEPLRADLDLLAVEIQRAQEHALRALHLRLEVGYREASLVPHDAAVVLGQL